MAISSPRERTLATGRGTPFFITTRQKNRKFMDQLNGKKTPALPEVTITARLRPAAPDSGNEPMTDELLAALLEMTRKCGLDLETACVKWSRDVRIPETEHYVRSERSSTFQSVFDLTALY